VHRLRLFVAPEAQIHDRLGKVGHHVDAGTPCTTPTFMVVPVSMLTCWLMASTQWASSVMAEILCARAEPAWEALPWKVMRHSGIALAGADDPARAGRLGHQHAAALSGFFTSHALDQGEPTSVAVAANQHLEPGQHGRVQLFQGIP
jgi:hypothetical protein